MKILYCILLFLFTFYAHGQVSDFNHINFKKADSIALVYGKEELSNLPQLTHLLTTNLNTDVERFRVIYKWVCNNIANDYGLYLKNKHKRKRFKDDDIKLNQWNTEFRKRLFKKLLKNKRTICTGYAYLVKTLAQLANIECEIVQGYGRVSTTNIEKLDLPNHSWNAVKLNDKWYLCDPTWASGIPNTETNRFIFQYNDGFFLASPKLFAINHFPIESKWWLLDKAIPSFDTFLAAPILYGNAYKNLINHNAPKQMHHTIKTYEGISFMYELKSNIATKTVSFLIDNGYNRQTIQPKIISITNKLLSVEHQFEHSGFYDVHLYIGEDLISTYTVKVKN